jgi:hypothetical protein
MVSTFPSTGSLTPTSWRSPLLPSGLQAFPSPAQDESGHVVVADVFTHQSVQMAFVEYDDTIEQTSPAVSNPAFCYAVLPRASEAAALWLEAETLRRADDFLIEIRQHGRRSNSCEGAG